MTTSPLEGRAADRRGRRMVFCILLALALATKAFCQDGFVPISDGSLKDRDGDATYWRAVSGVQVHVGPPMKIEFRNLRLKRLK